MEAERLVKLKKKFYIYIPGFLVIFGLMLFLPAGTFKYWQAWLFLATLFIPFLFVATYFLRKDPEFLERRLKYKEKERQEKIIIKISQVIFFIGLLIPGFDFRFHWSNVPIWLVILADIVIFISYIFIFLVFKENS